MTKKSIILAVIVVLILISGAFFLVKPQIKPKTITFGAAQKLSPDGFLAQIIKIYEIDKKHGIDINFQYNEPGLTMTKLLSKELEVAILAPVSAAKANLDGKKIRIFGPLLWNIISLAVPADSPYQTLEELKGKKFGILPQITGTYTNMDLVAREKGWHLENDFQLVIGGLEDQIKFLENRDVDFAVVYEPRASSLLAAGKIREITTMGELWKELTGERFAFVQIAAYEDWLKTHRKEAKSLVETFLEAAKFVNENPGLIEKHKDLLDLQTPGEIALAKKRIPGSFPTEWNQSSVDNINSLIKKAAEAGIITKMPEDPIVLILD